jgi:hypothetical protein
MFYIVNKNEIGTSGERANYLLTAITRSGSFGFGLAMLATVFAAKILARM